MTGEPSFDDDLARRLPLPLAQRYRRAHDAKTERDRHNIAYCLWQAALKRAAGLDGGFREDLDEAGGAPATVRLTELFGPSPRDGPHPRRMRAGPSRRRCAISPA